MSTASNSKINQEHGMIGNMRTAALVSNDGSIDFMCLPRFDSPSIFAKILDVDAGHFSIQPTTNDGINAKQQYLLATNILQTRFLFDEGVLQLTDFFHRNERQRVTKPLLPWLIRIVECVRGSVVVNVSCEPGFGYATEKHVAKVDGLDVKDETLTNSESHLKKSRVVFTSESGFEVDLRSVSDSENPVIPIQWKLIDGSRGPKAFADFKLEEGQSVAFVFRQTDTIAGNLDPLLTWSLLSALKAQTMEYWLEWIRKSNYKGRHRELVERSALVLKLLTYEPSGAIVASPTFGLPEEIGGVRNWDYRYVWIRDSAFCIYSFIRIGLTDEAEAYMRWIEARLKDAKADGSLSVMYTVDGGRVPEERILPHLEGNRGSKPVRVGNGARDHLQLDIYGALMDSVYLYNKYRAPIGYDTWVSVRKIVNYICDNFHRPDMSIWEIRSNPREFLFSKVMCWVGLDRGIRLLEKRSLPCVDRARWYAVRDQIYEEIMTKGWNPTLQTFTQSYEGRDEGTLDAGVLIMPMVFFCSPVDPRILSTIARIMKPPEKGGLTLNGLVYRYNHWSYHDGLTGSEGAFLMCTFWLVEALTRAGKHDPSLLQTALTLFEQTVSYGNSLNLFSEQVTKTGECLGNFPQAFTHLSLISAIFNLDRMLP
ncbi:hypothetical protein SmJEL517_g00771 [Synchytrium microbalum]|uniref:Uncharacterized protein n=1 Tax=Synchytrium microbalum TaxID=1806994 RepID=A0A507CE68_9FUNG|nr:uncharacterized protein SmJEL517_g00771 [Synchytrium microbalum]TPX37648.1 hypothetical protein SmJEL517_g00771 [Synchytrium microbalum]